MPNDLEQRHNSLVAEFPGEELIGKVGDWILPISGGIADSDEFDDEILVSGRFLGIGSTRTQQHVVRTDDGKYAQHDGEIVQPGVRCRACRWFEVRLFHDTSDDVFVIYYAGRSSIPGERQRCRFVEVRTHYEIFAVLSVARRQTNNQNQDLMRSNRFFFTNPVLRLLAQASGFHSGIKDAYVSYTSSK
jgi:hypothetical protein